MVTTEAAIMFAFLLTNFARVLAYLPQIVAIARDKGRAKRKGAGTGARWFVYRANSIC